MASRTIRDIASESMLDAVAASNLNPAVASSLFAEDADTQKYADARIAEILADLAEEARNG